MTSSSSAGKVEASSSQRFVARKSCTHYTVWQAKHTNPQKAVVASVITSISPSYAEIACGTAKILKTPGLNELFRLVDPGIVDLVQRIDLSWNTLEPSLVLTYQKLVDLSSVHHRVQIHIVESVTEEGSYHATGTYEGNSLGSLKQKGWK